MIKQRSLASLLPPAAEGGCTRNGTPSALLCLWRNRIGEPDDNVQVTFYELEAAR